MKIIKFTKHGYMILMNKIGKIKDVAKNKMQKMITKTGETKTSKR